MDPKKEIEYFDKLQDGDLNASDQSDRKEEAMLRSIAALDKIMKSEPLETTGLSFADRLITDWKRTNPNKSRFRLFGLMITFFGILIIISWLFAQGQQAITTPSYLNQIFDQMGSVMSMITDPRFKQIFLISEGIICLVILEKIISGYRFFKLQGGG